MHIFDAATIGVDHGDVVLFSDFEDGGQMWSGNGPRQSVEPVQFSEGFAKPPHVQVSISMWDISNSSNTRADVKAENITGAGFDIVFRTWADTRVARVRVSWTAIGTLPHDEGWDLY